METSPNRVQVGFTIIVCPKYRFVCITPKFSNECLCFMVPGSRSLGHRRLFFLLEGIQTLYFPSFQFVRQNPNEAQDGGSFRCSSHNTLVANSTLVSAASPFIGPTSYPSASVGRAPNFASGGFSTPSQRCNAPSRVAYIRDNLQVRGISPRAASYVLKGTEKQYSAAWKCFCCWCDRRQRNPLQADLETVCDFLTEQFEDFNKSYSTINSYRSALSSMLLPIDGYSVGEHPIIARLLKGMFHVRPPEPRYSFTWDVNVLLTFLESWFPLSALELKQVTLKTAALMALVSAQRSQTLSALSIDLMNSTATGTQFVVNSLLKSSRPGKSSLIVSLPAFPENEKLCAHSTLLHYIARTASIRQSLNSSQVFVSYGKPFKLFHLQPSQDGLKLFCRWQELIRVFLRVTVLEELRLRRQSVWEYP